MLVSCTYTMIAAHVLAIFKREKYGNNKLQKIRKKKIKKK